MDEPIEMGARGDEVHPNEIVKELLCENFNGVCVDYHRLETEWRTLSPFSNVGNLCVDWFTLGERLNTRMKSDISFYSFLQNFESKWKHKAGIQRLYNERPANSHIRRCRHAYKKYLGNPTIFKPLNTLAFLDILPCKIAMLDPTMGWGGRLIGACVFGIPHYIGIDSNVNLEIPYSRLCNFLDLRSDTQITTMFQNALDIDYTKLQYDLVLTSLPYYNIERYSGYTQYRTKREMNESFYKPLINRIFGSLSPDGNLALNINDEIYKYIRSFMGDCYLKIPFPARYDKQYSRNYMEYLYVWRKI
jgi:hypothetical protein